MIANMPGGVCAGNIAQIHPGSIPSPGVAGGALSVSQQALQTRTSVGAGISPILMTQV